MTNSRLLMPEISAFPVKNEKLELLPLPRLPGLRSYT
jgi:hypothetical protein